MRPIIEKYPICHFCLKVIWQPSISQPFDIYFIEIFIFASILIPFYCINTNKNAKSLRYQKSGTTTGFPDKLNSVTSDSDKDEIKTSDSGTGSDTRKPLTSDTTSDTRVRLSLFELGRKQTIPKRKKADDPDCKQTILGSEQTIRGESRRSCKP